MLDGCRQTTECSRDPSPKKLKALGPIRVVIDN
jgi:hypothetical protein